MSLIALAAVPNFLLFSDLFLDLHRHWQGLFDIWDRLSSYRALLNYWFDGNLRFWHVGCGPNFLFFCTTSFKNEATAS
jgi:hypothetical protein